MVWCMMDDGVLIMLGFLMNLSLGSDSCCSSLLLFWVKVFCSFC